MTINEIEKVLENEWLEKVLAEIKRQLKEKQSLKDNFKKDAIINSKGIMGEYWIGVH